MAACCKKSSIYIVYIINHYKLRYIQIFLEYSDYIYIVDSQCQMICVGIGLALIVSSLPAVGLGHSKNVQHERRERRVALHDERQVAEGHGAND